MKLRLFIALPLTSGLKKKIISLEEEVNKETGLKINWLPLDNLHLTILFLGFLNLSDYFKIEKVFDEFPWGYREFKKPFNLKITKIDYGPPGKNSMIWLYIEKDERLEGLKKFFEQRLTEEKVNFKKEERSFLPHINLCRLKMKLNKDLKKELNWSVVFNKIVLYESILKKPFAQYEPKKIIELKDKNEENEMW